MADAAYIPDNELTREMARFHELRERHGGRVSSLGMQGVQPVDMSVEARSGVPPGVAPGLIIPDAQGALPPTTPYPQTPIGIQGIDLQKRSVVVEGKGYAMDDEEVAAVVGFCLQVMSRELAKHVQALGESYGIAPTVQETPSEAVPQVSARKKGK